MVINRIIGGYECTFDAESLQLYEQTGGSVQVGKNGYTQLICTRGDYRYKVFARVLMSAPVGMEVDHIDGNGLNNQRSNLRICTKFENRQNRVAHSTKRSGLPKGVFYEKRDGSYRAQIAAQGTLITLGYFKTPEEASAIYERYAKILHGRFSTNASRS